MKRGLADLRAVNRVVVLRVLPGPVRASGKLTQVAQAQSARAGRARLAAELDRIEADLTAIRARWKRAFEQAVEYRGPLAPEARASLAPRGRNQVYSFVAGLGGREIRPASVEGVFRTILEEKADTDGINWVEVRV